MSMNKFMHPRNIYKSPPIFSELALQYPEFEKFVSRKPNGKIIFDFKNPDALRCLTLILLKKDFDLELTIPENKLIPTLPLRLNYILWIEDLLNWTELKEDPVSGIDIGTGATCIYPLLAAKKNGWKMMGTEIDASSVATAEENIKRNSLEHLISVKEVSRSTFLDGVVEVDEIYDFCMCNPPFFIHDADDDHRNSDQDDCCDADNFCSGARDEIQSIGGEVEFVKNIIQDSLKLRDQIKIYTTMIGQKSSLAPVLAELKKYEIKSASQTEFCQGRTVRWAVAWTLTENSLKHYSPLAQFKLPKPITWLFESKFFFQECAELKIPQLLSQLKIETTILENFKRRKLWRIIAFEETWTGLRKKRREQLRGQDKITDSSELIDDGNEESGASSEQNKTSVVDLTLDKNDLVPSTVRRETRPPIFVVKPKIKEACPKNNYCRLYSLNEKRKLNEESNVPSKKLKTNNDHFSALTNPQSCILQALLSVKSMQNKIELQILYELGKKDAPQQILQFLKNNLAK